MLKKILIASILLMLLAISQTATVFACSGFPYFDLADLPSMELLVKATVLETDDRGYNAIIRVENYYKGEGAQILTVMRYPVSLSSGALVRGYDTGCLYAGRGHRWVAGTQGYFGLNSNGNGTFSDEYVDTAHFYPVDSMIYYEEGATEGYAVELDEPKVIAEEDFVNLLLEAGEREQPIQPSFDWRQYPLRRFLNITTEKGTRYEINPDRSLRQLTDGDPFAISPDGSHVAFRLDNGTIAFRYIFTTYDEDRFFTEIVPDDFFRTLEVTGQNVLFSNDSNLAVVWNTDQFTIVMLMNDSTYNSGYGAGIRVQQLAQLDVMPSSDETLLNFQWSADSTTLVWQDGSGLWWWNFYENAEPTQLENGESQALIDVSRYGRYIRFGTSEAWTLLDVETGETYPNALISPNEQFLIQLDTQIPKVDSEDEEYCKPPLRDTCVTQTEFENLLPIATFPYRMNMIGLIYCPISAESCYVITHSWQPSITNFRSRRDDFTPITDVRKVAYDVQNNMPAILIGEYEIFFDFYSNEWVDDPDNKPYLDILDLEGQLDSPITHIEWGQAIFYDEYSLTTTEYLNP